MTLLRSIKVLANDGATVKEIPVWANGTASGSYYELLKFDDGVDPNAGFVAFGPTSTPPYDLIYGNPSANLQKVLVGPPGVAQSAEQSSSTASTLASYNGGANFQVSPGEEIQVSFQMSSTVAAFQNLFIYWANTNASGLSNYYRLVIEYQNNKCELQKNGGMLATTTFSSRPLSTWCQVNIDYRKSSGTTMTADIIDTTTSLSILNSGLSSTDTSFAGTGFAYYVKAAPGDPIIISDMKKS